MQTTTRSLFGGCLLAAGLVANPAAAQTFVLLPTSPDGAYQSQALADAFSYDALSYAVDILPPLFVNDAGFATGYGTTVVTAATNGSEMFTEADWFGGGLFDRGLGLTTCQQFFRVSSPAFIRAEWSLAGTDGTAFAFIADSFSPDFLLLLDPLTPGTPLSGSVLIPADPRTDYLTLFGFDPTFDFGGTRISSLQTQFIHFTLEPRNPIDFVPPFGTLTPGDVVEAINRVALGVRAGDFSEDGLTNFLDVIEIDRIVDATTAGG